MHQLSEETKPWGVDSAYSMTRSAGTIAKAKGMGGGKKYNLMGQVIPIYGFGILLYMLYIIYKLTCKGKPTKSRYISTLNKTHMESEITNESELLRLQEKLLQTEKLMQRITSGKSRASVSGRRRKSKTAFSKKEDKLLKHLRQLTQLMQEGRLEGASPEMEAEEVPYGADWEGYPEETYPQYEPCDRHGFNTIILESTTNQPTAEALAERMEQEEEEVIERKLDIVQEEEEEEEDEEQDKEEHEEQEETDDMEEGEAEKRQLLSPPPSLRAEERREERIGLEVSKELRSQNGGKKQITFSEQKDVFQYPKEDNYEEEEEEDVIDEEEEKEEEEEDGVVEEEEEEEEEDGVVEAEEEVIEEEEDIDEEDPVMEAESLNFSCEVCSNPEEEAEEGEEENLLLSQPVEDEGQIQSNMAKEVGVSGLRMRNRRKT
ncbi:hypothetical protein LDENG_00121170 [Lucifuga dentata]|nr:hypothetical protein LDENG_00121170 [Lucifuga dentata]